METTITVGSKVQRSTGGPVGTVRRIWVAVSWTGAPLVPERRMARVRWVNSQSGGTRLGSVDGMQESTIQLDSLIPAVLCPECGGPMRRHGRGATARKNGYYWTCIRAEREVYKDERGHLHRQAGAKHDRTRCWTMEDLGAVS